MSKEIYISSTPHETRLAIVEDEALAEIYYERENEYTLAGSIYNGRVTRVLPGMQSSFVDIGLDRDAFLYITDFLEEAPDSEEFDTAPAGDRAPRPAGENGVARSDSSRGDRDRGGRGRRGGRDRNRDRDRSPDHGPDRSQSERTPADPEAIDAPYAEAESANPGFAPHEGEGSGEAAPPAEGAVEGGRRWRGRRGRRRGRGSVGHAGEPAQENAAPSESGPQAGNEQDVSPEPTQDSDQEFEASAEESPATSSGETPRTDSGNRDRSRRDDGRNRPRRDGRGFEPRRDQGRNQASDQHAGQDSGLRAPRGFEPRRDRYGASGGPSGTGPIENAYDAPSAGEPIILPGESLSKYRRSEEPAASASASHAGLAPANSVPVTLAPPASLYTVPAGWDGGDVLPGETLSRHRTSESRPAESHSDTRPDPRGGSSRGFERDRGPRSDREPRRDPRPDNRDNRDDRSNQRPEQHPGQHGAATSPEIPHESVVPGPASAPEFSAPVAAVPATSPAPAVEADYEPSEASASYRVDPSAPSEFRQSAPTLELPVEPAAEAHDFTAISAAGEMQSEPAEPIPVHPTHPAPIEPVGPASPMRHEQAVVSADPESHIAAPSATGFTPGAGQLDEEILDEEDAGSPTLHASSIEEMDDLDEETLEGAADLGTMLREMSIDQITRTQPEVDEEDDEDEDDFEEDLLEEEETEDDEEDEEEDANGFQLDEQAARGEVAEPGDDLHDRAAGAEPSESHFDQARSDGEHFDEGHSDTRTAEGGPSREPGRDSGRDSDRRGGRRDGRRDNRRGDRDRNDRGRGRMGHGGDHPRRSSAQTTNLPAISDLLKPGQEILVQIAKEPIAKKGARITSHIALPGRFLVFMPTVNHTGVSRKIESDSERPRPKEILLSEKGDASGGFIVRTAAEGATEEELRSDLRFLLNLWTDIKARSDGSKSPALIYHDLNLVERILRDQVTDNFSAIWVDTEAEYERVLRFLQRFQPSLIRRVKLYLKETPLFEQFGITEEINKALRSKVWLKSGGSIVINQTEALVAIDINTGKYVGKTARLEDTIVKTNLDAIPEIVRQIRLRDLGGIIIIDFIDMDERKNRNRVMAALEDELKNDRAPSKVLQFNDFGLVAITRKRVKQSLERTLSTTCATCTGTGMVKSAVTVCNDIYVEMRKMHKHLDRGDVMLRVHPEVVKQLKSSGAKWLQEMEEMAGKTILVKSDPSLHPEQFDIH